MSSLMPNFTDALNERLRKEAVRSARRSRRTQAGAAALVTVLAATGVLLSTTGFWTTGQTSLARAAEPLTALAPTVSGEVRLRDVAATLGDGAVLERGWSVPALKGSVFLAHNNARWCLSVPDPATSQPDVERGQSCKSTAAYRDRGLSLTIGNRFVAVLPDGIPDPTVTKPMGAPTSLTRIDRGLVLSPPLQEGSVIERVTAAGKTVTDRFDPPDVRVWNCPDGSFKVADRSGPNPCP